MAGFVLIKQNGKRFYYQTLDEALTAADPPRPSVIIPWDRKDGATAVYNRRTREIIDIQVDRTPSAYISGLADGKDLDLLPTMENSG